MRYQEVQEKQATLLIANRDLEEFYLDAKKNIDPLKLKNVDRKLREAIIELKKIETQKRNKSLMVDAEAVEQKCQYY